VKAKIEVDFFLRRVFVSSPFRKGNRADIELSIHRENTTKVGSPKAQDSIQE
jgi:hypothetical protein